VDPSERASNDHAAAVETRLEGGVLASRALSVVLPNGRRYRRVVSRARGWRAAGRLKGTHVVNNEHPRLVLRLVPLGNVGDRVLAVRVDGDVDLATLVIDGGDEQVLRDVGQVALVLEPGTGGRDVIRRARTRENRCPTRSEVSRQDRAICVEKRNL